MTRGRNWGAAAKADTMGLVHARLQSVEAKTLGKQQLKRIGEQQLCVQRAA